MQRVNLSFAFMLDQNNQWQLAPTMIWPIAICQVVNSSMDQ
jgi:hypothetical protein